LKASAAITALSELVHQPRSRRKPTEFGACPCCGRALIEEQHLGEIVAEARASFVV
jgi:4-hydroxy-3-methylbut-2-en-1-yl diphosphate synthase IspG/GcpE